MTYQSINPATGDVVKTFPAISDSDLEKLVQRAQSCFETDWSRRSVEDRAAVVSAAAHRLRNKVDEFAGYLTLEMGKRIDEARGEVMLSADILDYYAEHAARYLEPQTLEEAPGNILEKFPLGIILGVEPWNFPYYQVVRVAGPQLMVGNVLMIKHSSTVPQSALALERLFRAAGAPDGLYTNLFANFDQVARLIDDPRVRGATLTGSTGAGAAVAERAGRNLKKSVLELGGSDPLIVLEDAPFEPTLKNAVWGRMNNTGQSCVASKRIIVVGKDRGEKFLDGLVERMSALEPGDPADPATTLGPMSSEDAMNRLLGQIDEAREGGAHIALGGGRIDRPGFYVEPTVVTGIDKDNPIFTEELFGPVVSYYVVDNEDEAIALANATPFGLGGSVFTADLERGQRVAERIDSGMIFVNHPTLTAPELPFGGVKGSGYGRELSELGFGEFVNRKLISIAPAGSPPPSLTAAG